MSGNERTRSGLTILGLSRREREHDFEFAATEAREHLGAAQKAAERARMQAALERSKRIAAIRAAIRARRARSVYSVSRRARTWCYNPSFPAPTASRYARLAGFCRG